MWLKGTLSVKLNMKYSRILEFLKKQVYPAIDYELKGYILRIPLVSIQNWYQKQSRFHNPEVLETLSHFRCEFGLNDGITKDVFRLIHEMEIIGHREIRDLTVPCSRSVYDFSEMQSFGNVPAAVPHISEIDIQELNKKLKEIDLWIVCTNK